MRFTRSNGTAPWSVGCEDFGTSAAAAIVDTKTGKKVAFAVDQIALGFPDSYLNLSHGDLMLDALNVHEATGLTPSQLQARVAELEAALNRTEVAINTLDYCYTRRPENFALALVTAKSDALCARDVLDAKP